MPLTISISQQDGVAIVRLNGHLILLYGPKLHQAVKRLAAHGVDRVLLDLSGVNYIDDHGIGQIAACSFTLQRKGGQLRCAGLKRKVFTLIEDSVLRVLVPIDAELPAAIAKLSPSQKGKQATRTRRQRSHPRRVSRKHSR